MNNKLRKLNHRALLDVFNSDISEDEKDKMYVPSAYTERLAELIVKELAEITEQPGYSGRRDLDWMIVFKHHFGVK